MLRSAYVDDAIVSLLARIDSLRALQIAKARLSIDGVKTLASMARLEALSLREQDLPPGTCAVLASAGRLRWSGAYSLSLRFGLPGSGDGFPVCLVWRSRSLKPEARAEGMWSGFR
jgi:hypothetical protein